MASHARRVRGGANRGKQKGGEGSAGAERQYKEVDHMPTSGTTETGLRLLEAFHDLSGGNLVAPISVVDASERTGINAHSVERDIAVRYLLNEGYLKAADTEDTYTLTVAGKDRVKEMRGIGAPAPNQRRRMSEQTQQRLETLFAAGIGFGLSRLVAERFIKDLVPEQRGIKDDVLRSLMRAVTTGASTILASVIVRWVARARQGS